MSKTTITYSSLSKKVNYEEGYIDSEKVESFIEYSYYHTNKLGKITVVVDKECFLERNAILFSSLDIEDFKTDIKDEIMDMALHIKPERWEDGEVHIIIPIKQMRGYSALARNRLFKELVREYTKNKNIVVKVNEMLAENWLYLIGLKTHWNKKYRNRVMRVLNSIR